MGSIVAIVLLMALAFSAGIYFGEQLSEDEIRQLKRDNDHLTRLMKFRSKN